MNINTLKFRFITLNVFIEIILITLLIAFATFFTKRFIIEERVASRKLVNNQVAFKALPVVVGTGKGIEKLFDEFLLEYPDLIYCVAISITDITSYYSNTRQPLWFIKNESIARQYEELFSKRPQRTEVYRRNRILHIISPVYGVNDEGSEGIVGYILSGYSIDLLMGKLRDVNLLVMLACVVVLLVVIFVVSLVTNLFLKPLKNAVEVINNVAHGDFTRDVSIRSKSEIGILISTINEMISQWRTSIKKLIEIILYTNKSAENLSDAIKQQENVTSEQASAVNEITTTVDELNSSSKQVYEKAERVSQSSNDVLKISSEGQKAIKNSIEEINVIRTKVKTISEHTLNLSMEAQQIGSIVKTVSDIANKTDMLAINAGIEAARAGEHGRGFSIVATEVRELAEQSRKSAEKIAKLIENIQSATNTTVLATDETINGFQVGIDLILEAGHTIDNLVKHIQETVNYASEIALASRQQSLGTEQVASVMSSINEAMRGTAQNASKILEEANNLKKLSDDLASVANMYKI